MAEIAQRGHSRSSRNSKTKAMDQGYYGHVGAEIAGHRASLQTPLLSIDFTPFDVPFISSPSSYGPSPSSNFGSATKNTHYNNNNHNNPISQYQPITPLSPEFTLTPSFDLNTRPVYHNENTTSSRTSLDYHNQRSFPIASLISDPPSVESFHQTLSKLPRRTSSLQSFPTQASSAAEAAERESYRKTAELGEAPGLPKNLKYLARFIAKFVALCRGWHSHSEKDGRKGNIPASSNRTVCCAHEKDFVEYIETVLTTTDVSRSIAVLALHFIYKVCMIRVTDPNSSEKLDFTIGILLANKVLDDHTFTNRTWSDLSRTDIGTINRAEVDYLSLLGHKMILKRQEFVNWVSEVEHSYKRLQENKLPSLFEHQKARKFSPNILLPHLNEFQQLEQMQHLPSLQHVGPVYVQDAGYIRPQPYQYYPMAASAAFSEPSPTPNSYNPFQQTLSRRHSFDVALLDQLNGFSVEPKAQAQESSHDVHIHGSTPLSQFSDPGFHDLFPQSNQFTDPTGFSPNYMSDGGMDWARTQSFQQNNGFAPPLSAPMQFNTPSGLPYATGGLAMNYGHHLPHQQPASQQYMYKSHDQYPQLPPRTSSKGQMSEQDLFNAQFLQYPSGGFHPKPPMYPSMPRSSSDVIASDVMAMLDDDLLGKMPPYQNYTQPMVQPNSSRQSMTAHPNHRYILGASMYSVPHASMGNTFHQNAPVPPNPSNGFRFTPYNVTQYPLSTGL